MQRIDIGQHFLDALKTGSSAAFDAFRQGLRSDVAFSTLLRSAEGADAVTSLFRTMQAADSFPPVTEWTGPTEEDGRITIRATLPPTAFNGIYAWTFFFDTAGLVQKIDQAITRYRSPVPPSPMKVTDQIKAAFKGSLDAGGRTIVAYINEQGQPSLSIRGTVQLFGNDQIAFWARYPDGGVVKAIPRDPNVSILLYGAGGVDLQFQGRAHAETDPAIRNAIYDNSPPVEQRADPQRKGVAILIDLDRVSGIIFSGSGTRLNLVRG